MNTVGSAAQAVLYRLVLVALLLAYPTFHTLFALTIAPQRGTFVATP